MRDLNRLERAVVVLVLYVWQLIEAIREAAYVPAGVDDVEWQDALHSMAAPVKKKRLAEEAMLAHALPALAVPVVTGDGVVTIAMPMTEEHHLRNHRTFEQPKVKRPRVRAKAKRALLAVSGAPEVLALENLVRGQLDVVVMEAMRALGLTAQEARRILNVPQMERTLDQVMGLA